MFRHFRIFQILNSSVFYILCGKLDRRNPGTKEISFKRDNNLCILKLIIRHDCLTETSFICLNQGRRRNCVVSYYPGIWKSDGKISYRFFGCWTLNGWRNNSYLTCCIQCGHYFRINHLPARTFFISGCRLFNLTILHSEGTGNSTCVIET